MLKFTLGIAIVAFCTFCGYLLSKKYRKRKVFLAEFYDFNERFLTEISYYRRPIMQWLSENTFKQEFGMLVQLYVEQTTRNLPLQGIVTENPDFNFLRKEEKIQAEKYFSMLGKGDSLSQKNYFSANKSTLETWCKKAEIDAKKYVDLYVKIGFLFGLFILILIV